MMRCKERLESVSLERVIRFSREVWPEGTDVRDGVPIDFFCSLSGVLLAFANPLNDTRYAPVIPEQAGSAACDQGTAGESYASDRACLCDGAHDTGGAAMRCLGSQPGCVRLEEVIRFVMYVPDVVGDEQRVDYFFSQSGKLLAYHDYSSGLPGVVAERDLGIVRVRPAIKSLSE